MPDIPQSKVAFVIDNEVIEVLHTDSRLAAILLSEPTIVDVSELGDAATSLIGMIHDPESGTFSKKDQ